MDLQSFKIFNEDYKREEYGMEGHKFVMSDESMQSATSMCQNFIDHMDTAFDKWKPRKRYSIYKA